MTIIVRSYQNSDYKNLKQLYENSSLYGGQFDENRDGKERLKKRIEGDPAAILIAEENGEMVGTVSLIEDGRVAWLFRFCVIEKENSEQIAQSLFAKAKEVFNTKGHHQVLVYTPVGNEKLLARYEKLGSTKGGDYTCYWKDI